ncbi:bifunctional RNase H/acid phosphatase [Corynebacterium occultum]|uniref:Bifunctional RNase H/acid phosphatase n=1 Tax=Corynebacterium occultum TaxID=2675219 RepID=A0A6B8W9C3_9CORY|nr:histidine phosphatase family protein [Corynebacterium occultum]QGU08557.1 bifunctional RNase H/acid phosphatase [Corynebacterium occultum]
MSGRIILLRHGQTHSNVSHILDTRPPGAELTELGRAQADEVGRELADFLGAGQDSEGSLGAVISSVALRAQQTAVLTMASYEQAAGKDPGSIPIDVRLGIHEVFAGDHEGYNDEETHRNYAQILRQQLERDTLACLPNGETYPQVLERFRPVLESVQEEVAARDKDTIIVSHGTAIRTAATYATGVDGDFAFAGYIANCRYIVLEPGDAEFGAWKLVRWADLDHQI